MSFGSLLARRITRTIMGGNISAKEHIEEIRRVKFSIGGDPNPLTEDLHHAVRNLSSELYTKDVHFLLEIIQNADDNEYPPGVDPSLEFLITSKDITSSGASATLLVFNNETGFSKKNIESICSVGRSTKKGRRQVGFIGEKGIGFKSVFLVTSQPHIFSNGYQIKFTEDPTQECSIGYIVPHWVDSPTIGDIHDLYGSEKALPTTVLVLPLKSEKIDAVKKQLSSLHPEVLFFLSKIKRVLVHESNHSSSISITSEREYKTIKNINADSHIVYLSAKEGEDQNNDECSYYIWRQKFPVKVENRIDTRREIENWSIALAFPFGVRLKKGSLSSGIYAFLPTEMVTNFPFVIQADFLLTSSREAIILNNKWNLGILECISSAFVNALVSLVKSVTTASVSSIVEMFKFLPIQKSPVAELDFIRESIKEKVQSEQIMPCETFTEHKVFSRPRDVMRILPSFRKILLELHKRDVSLENACSPSQYILHSDADFPEYDDVLSFLGVRFVDFNWYTSCIDKCNLALHAGDDIYLELLFFVADNWCQMFSSSTMQDIPLLKYIDVHGEISLCSIRTAATCSNHTLYFSKDPNLHEWLNKWNLEFKCVHGLYGLPNSMIISLSKFTMKDLLRKWLVQHASVNLIDIPKYALVIANILRDSRDKDLLLSYTHFLYHSLRVELITTAEVSKICATIPIITKNGKVAFNRRAVIVPAIGSNWQKLLCSDSYFGENYVELGNDYMLERYIADEWTPEDKLMDFMRDFLKPLDVPELPPLDLGLPIASSLLSKERALLLLEWIRHLMNTRMIPENKFLTSVREGKWLKTCSSTNSPNRCFLPGGKAEDILSRLNLGSIKSYRIDESFYDYEICNFKKELKFIGVSWGFQGAYTVISKHFSLISDSEFTKDEVISLLSFLRYSFGNKQINSGFIENIKKGRWLKTTNGYQSPARSAYMPSGELGLISRIANFSLVDTSFYGSEIHEYTCELKMLGVLVDLEDVCSSFAKSIAVSLTSANISAQLTKDDVISILHFIRYLKQNNQLTVEFVNRVKEGQWLKTTQGLTRPAKCLYVPQELDANLILMDLPLIDEQFYGYEIGNYTEELMILGVLVTLKQVYSMAARKIVLSPELSHSTQANGLLVLNCIKHLTHDFYFMQKLKDNPWLKTDMGYKYPREVILFESPWDCLQRIVPVPVVDEAFYGIDIREYKKELAKVGVAVEFKQACRVMALAFKKQVALSGLRSGQVLLLLEAIKSLRVNKFYAESEFTWVLSDEKWLLTRCGYREPRCSILFDPEWESVSRIADLPFVNVDFYGDTIYTYKDELSSLGVVTTFRDGPVKVMDHLKLPKFPHKIDAQMVIALLNCIRSMMQSGESLPEQFLKKTRAVKWLRTRVGYRYPYESFIYDSNWEDLLEIDDAPFIDEDFYGPTISLYKEELRALGAISEAGQGCSVVADSLTSQKSLSVIKRLYKYLKTFKWVPEQGKSNALIWIPNADEVGGVFVAPNDCILHDENHLFEMRPTILSRYYEELILQFFSSAFKVRYKPGLRDYLKLWRTWEVTQYNLDFSKCFYFWKYIISKWSSELEKKLWSCIKKLPAVPSSGVGVRLVDKRDVLIPDDLQLRKLFEEAYPEEPLFIWCPDPTVYSLSLVKLYDIYKSLRVRSISSSICKCSETSRFYSQLRTVTPSNSPIQKGLIKIILAFMSIPSYGIPIERRHNIARNLMEVKVVEADEPITISYRLNLPSTGRSLSASANDMIRWEKNSGLLIMSQMHGSKKRRLVEFADRFALVISNGLLWDASDLIGDLLKLIYTGCILGFDSDAVDFLLTKENLQLFKEDETFISAAFSSQ